MPLFEVIVKNSYFIPPFWPNFEIFSKQNSIIFKKVLFLVPVNSTKFYYRAKTVVIYQIYKDRGGEYGFNIEQVLPGRGRYENIEDEPESFHSNSAYKELLLQLRFNMILTINPIIYSEDILYNM